MDRLSEYRAVALETLRRTLEPESLHDADGLLDDAIRVLKRLPERPPGVRPYERLFRLPEVKLRPLSKSILRFVLPDSVETFWEALNETFERYAINTPLRVAHFLAQTAHESAGYTRLTENLNYSADGLMSTWPSRFDRAKAEAYSRQPDRIANLVYANRLGNGSESSGDGWRYRGRGIIQITGKAKYEILSREFGTDLMSQPELMAEAPYAVLSAGWYWHQRGINRLADANDVRAVTKAVNGGLIGLSEREKILAVARTALGARA